MIRPDMWGFADTEPRVFLENKFWAGLTENQPISYLKRLAADSQPTILLVVAPAAREHTLWRELTRQLLEVGIQVSERRATPGIARSVTTQLGPILALTSWTNVLLALEHEAANDPSARSDLVQLRALCDAADNDAFTPVTLTELSDQRRPAFILQLNSIVQETVSLAVRENVLSTTGLRPQASGERIGQYAWVSGDQGAGAWLGIHFRLWKEHGATPLWLLFGDDKFGRGPDVRRLIEPWAIKNRIHTAITHDNAFAMALDIPVGEEKAGVIRSLVNRIKAIGSVLAPFRRKDMAKRGKVKK